MERARYVEILRLLAHAQVEFVVVGMAAGILQGAPSVTLDIDIVHRRTPENVERLLGVLTQIHAVTRYDERKLMPGPSHLLGPGHQLLSTDHGDLDCLGAVDDGVSYEDLLPFTTTILLNDGLSIQVLGLEKLIEIKRRAGRPKDLAVMPILEATLAEVARQKPRS
jgi:hypothetical protein